MTQERSSASPDAGFDRNPAVEAELARLFDVRGMALLEQSRQLREALFEAVPSASHHISLLLAALSAGVGERLREVDQGDARLQDVLADCVRTLQRHGVEDLGAAWWAVRTWAHAFALPTFDDPAPGVGKRIDRTVAAPAAPSFAEVVRESVIAPRAARSAPATTPAVEPASTRLRADPPAPAPRESPVLSANTRPPAEPTPAPPIATHAFEPPLPASSSRQEPAFGAFADPHPEPMPEPVAPAGAEFVEGSSLQIEPLFGEPAFSAADSGPSFASSSATRGGDGAPPMAGLRADDTDWRPERKRDGGRVGLIVALVIGLPLAALLGMVATRWAKPSTPTTVAAADSATSTEGALPKALSTAPPAATPSPVAPSAATIDAPAPVEAPQRTAAPDESIPPATPMAAARVIPSPSAPAPATAAATAPSSSVPPAGSGSSQAYAIARIDVPTIVEGAPFQVAVQVADPRDVVSIERRIRDAVGSWPRAATSLPVSGLQRAGNTFYIPFRAMDAPARATVEFSVVARHGARGPSKAVTLIVADTYAAPVRAAAEAALTGGTTCTPSICGSVVGVRDVEPDSHSQSRLYEVTVLMDDKEQYVFTAPYRPANGARMRMSNGSFSNVAQ